MTRWAANILIWLCLTAEVEGMIYNGKWDTPLTIVGTALFKTVAHIVPWDILVVITLLFAWSNVKKVLPGVMASLKLTALALVAMWLWGVLRGGSAYQTYFQLHPFVMGLVMILLVTATCRTPAHVASLGKVIVFACLYRSVLCITYYLLVARHLEEVPAALTDHCDSVLFVGGWFILIINALERRTLSSVLWLVLSSIPIVAAIVLNNRRIAWLGVGVGLFLLYLLLEPGKLKRRINWTLVALSPVLAAYIAVGWGQPVGIFKPVGSISTMFGENQDTSSIMRDIENYNLLRTLKSNPVLGFGFGREYIEEIVAFDISSIFSQYRYLPHNSLLGLIAFTGMLGFWGIWQLVVVTVFVHARVYRNTRVPLLRTASLSCLVGIAIIQIQMWGDIGFNHQMVCVMLAVGVALAARLPAMARLAPVPTPTAASAAPAAAGTSGLSPAADQVP